MEKITKKNREKYVTTIKKLVDYASQNYADWPANEMLDSTQKYTYSELFEKSRQLSEQMSSHGIGTGAKVAIYSQNMPNWAVAFYSIVPYSRVAIPILAESSETEVENILNHSETSVLFVSESKLNNVSETCMSQLTMVINLDTLEVIKEKENSGKLYSPTSEPKEDDLAGIFYTSGTTGMAKGVMLSHKNLCQNVIAARHATTFGDGCRWLSILPMAHTYEMAFSLLFPLYVGASVYYLQKAPTTSVLINALKRVKPHIVCSVPLIIEKVYKSSVRKTINKSKFLSWMEKNCKGILYFIIGRKLKKFFGGHLKFFGIGGAKLDPTVEAFLIKARFPYAIGYGLTETAPLITFTRVGKGRCGSIGAPAYRVNVRLGDKDPHTGQGEIQCKGPNVMLGYYKDPERTASVFTKDGWFKTGDLASQDKRGYYYIKGRIGSMIVGPSGENIYPEEIESVINNINGVNESLVISKNGKLIALVNFDDTFLDYDYEMEEKVLKTIEEKKKEIMDFVNKNVRKSNNINDVEVMKTPFVKTATQKIRRFLYQQKD